MTPVQCPNPNCYRCQKALQAQLKAKENLDSVTISDRLRDSVYNPQKYITRGQAPTVLMAMDLPSQEIVTDRHSELKDYLTKEEGCASSLLQEMQQTPSTLWIENETPTGSWEVMFLMNQGKWNLKVWDACPKLAQLVDSMPNLLDESLFGNAMISIIKQGTTIEPHCGSSNVRHRLQMTLQSPKIVTTTTCEANLRVGISGQKVDWSNTGGYFVFDDSFVHSVDYPYAEHSTKNTSDDGGRIVLIVDLWNPCLDSMERDAIRHLYPPG